jgi:hypothetical protein
VAEAERQMIEAAWSAPSAPERRVAAMTERRDVAVARVPEAPSVEGEAENENEEYGPLGPGIRPADFWGA